MPFTATAASLAASDSLAPAIELDDTLPPTARPLSNETLRLWKAFAPMAAEPRRAALAVGVIEPVRAGDANTVGDDFVVVVSGSFAVHAAAGSALTVEFLRPGDILSSGSGAVTTGSWITDGEIYRADRSAWLARGGDDALAFMVQAMEARRSAVHRRLLCTVAHRATPRVADLILSIHEGAPGAPIRMSQERLGGMLGLRRTTVNACCQALESEGALHTLRGKVRVVDAARLSARACGCRNDAAGSV